MQKIMHAGLEAFPEKLFLQVLTDASKIKWKIIMGTGEKTTALLKSRMGLDSNSGLTQDVHQL